LISVTRLNGDEFNVNAELIETLESTPDTLITLTTGRKMMVLESTDEVIDRVLQYRSQIAGIRIRRRNVVREG